MLFRPRASFFVSLNLLLIVVVAFGGACKHQSAGAPELVSGRLDLRDWNFQRDGIVSFKGAVEFYWQNLLEPSDFSEQTTPFKFVEIPAYWNGTTVDGRKLDSDGYATYRWTVELPSETEQHLAVKILEMGSAYRLSVNGKLVATNGVVGRTADSMRPYTLPGIFLLPEADDQLEFVLQVSNFYHRFGGARFPIQLGLFTQILDARETALNVDMFLFGCLMMMSIYHLGLYLQRRKYVPPIYFSIFCFLIALRATLTGERYFFHFFPGFDWEIGQKMEFICYYAAVPVFATFLYETFREEFSFKVVRVIQIITPIFLLVVLFTPARIFGQTSAAYQIITLIMFLYALYVLVLASVHKKTGARSFLFGMVVFLGTFVNDVLYSYGFLQTGYYIPFGVVAFISSQAFLLSRRFSNAFSTIEHWSEHLEQKVAERTHDLNAAMEMAEINARVKNEFLANMSHEIRTPMNAVLGFTELALEGDLEPEIREYLQIVERRGRDLQVLINDILDLSKIEAGRMEIKYTPVRVRELTGEIAQLFTPAVREKGLELNYRIETDVPEFVFGDEVRLRQLLINLVSNAIKFTERGNITILIKPMPDSNISGDKVRLYFSVSDTGIGIPPDKQSLIFDSFTQADGSTSRKYGGTGLGLHICKNLVGLMNGTIGVKSEPGSGSEFYFILELRAQAGGSLTENNVDQFESRTESERPFLEHAPAIRVLVADDDSINQLLIRRILEKHGYSVTTVNSGKAAVEQVQDRHFELILMDGQMPEMDGLEAMRIIRELQKTSAFSSRIIALTGLSMAGDRERFLHAGFDDYLTKPIETEKLLKTLRNHK